MKEDKIESKIKSDIYSLNPIIIQVSVLKNKASAKKKYFSLIELLVVISIISILASLLAPSLTNAMDSAKRISCSNNLKQNIFAVHMYISDSYDYLFTPMLNAGDHNGVSVYDVIVWDYMSRPSEPPKCPNLASFTYRDASTQSIGVNAVDPPNIVGGGIGTLATISSDKSYFPNNWRKNDEKTGDGIRNYAGLFKNGSNPLKVSEVESDTIAAYENYRCDKSTVPDAYDNTRTWGIKGHSFSGVTTGFHKNEGLNAAIIDGSVKFIDVYQLLSDSKYELGGVWGTNDGGHFWSKITNTIAGDAWNWNTVP